MIFKLIANWSIPNERSFYLAFYNIGFMFSQTISTVFIISSISNSLQSWRILYFVNTIVIAGGAILFLRENCDSPSTHPRIKASERGLIERESRNEVQFGNVGFNQYDFCTN